MGIRYITIALFAPRLYADVGLIDDACTTLLADGPALQQIPFSVNVA